MGILKVEENRIIFEKRDEYVVIEPWGEDCIRFRSSPNGYILEQDWNLLKQKKVNCTISEESSNSKGLKMTNGNLSMIITEKGQVTYYKGEEMLITERSEFAFFTQYREYLWREADNHKSTVIFEPNENEHFYGLGHEQKDCFDLKGSTSLLLHKNTKASIPFVYSSRGYGFLWNNPSVGRCELSNNHTLWEANSTKQVDYLIMVGDQPSDIMNKYADLTGYAPKFPDWASGFWQCRLRYEDEEEFLQVAERYQEENIPVSAMVIDYFHWPEQGDWKLDSKYWPNPKRMTEKLESMGIKTMVSIWPTINPKSENYKHMNDRNMLVRTERGPYSIYDFYGTQTYVDTSKKEARDYMWSKVKENYYDNGIKSYWLDQAEPDVQPAQFDNLRFSNGNGEEVALLYPYNYAKLFYEGLKSEGEEDVISLARAAWIGSQKYGALLWNGDVPSTFEALKMSVKSGLNVAMCGIPWWNSDIGGFWGGDIESDYFKELLVRWFQFGLFCPVMRLHGHRVRTKNQVGRNPGVNEPSGGDNELWSFGETNFEILKKLVELRERLRPYIHHYMTIASETGSPLMRPMFYDYSQDEVCYTLDDQYMFGEDILFAPIVNQGQTDRRVYLPEGKWMDVNSNDVYEGKQYIVVHAEIDTFIAFVKEGAAIRSAFEGLTMNP